MLTAFVYASAYISIVKKPVQEHCSANLDRNWRTSDANSQRKAIFKDNHYYSVCRFVCVVPPMIFFQIYDLLGLTEDKCIFRKIFLSILYVNFAVNPLIYVCQNIAKHFTWCILLNDPRRAGGLTANTHHFMILLIIICILNMEFYLI